MEKDYGLRCYAFCISYLADQIKNEILKLCKLCLAHILDVLYKFYVISFSLLDLKVPTKNLFQFRSDAALT